MIDFLRQFHGYWSIIVVLLTIIAFGLSLMAFLGKKEIDTKLRKISLFCLISFHTQMVIGVFMLLLNSSLTTSYKILSSVNIIEHISMLLTSVLLITIFNSKIKKSTHISGAMLAMIGFVLFYVLSRVVILVIEFYKINH